MDAGEVGAARMQKKKCKSSSTVEFVVGQVDGRDLDYSFLVFGSLFFPPFRCCLRLPFFPGKRTGKQRIRFIGRARQSPEAGLPDCVELQQLNAGAEQEWQIQHIQLDWRDIITVLQEEQSVTRFPGRKQGDRLDGGEAPARNATRLLVVSNQ